MTNPHIIRRDGMNFSESRIDILIAGFEGSVIEVEVEWFSDRGERKRDRRNGRYPWVDIRWPGSHSDPSSRKAGPFLAALADALVIEQYIMSGIIRQHEMLAVSAGGYESGQVIKVWKVVRHHPDNLFETIPGMESMEYRNALRAAIAANQSANLGLYTAGGVTEADLQLKAYEKNPHV